MTKILFLCDVDGVVAPIPYVEVFDHEANITELDYALGRRRKLVRKEADPELYFVPDQKVTVDFVQGYEPFTKIKPVTIEYSTELIERLRNIAENPNIDFRWCTMWNVNAVNLLNPLFDFDVPHLQVQDHASEMYRWFKSYAIFDMLKAKNTDAQTLIWVDDTHNIPFVNHPEESQGFHSNVFAKEHGMDSLVISPNTLWGISREEMAVLEGFIAKLA